MPRRFFIGAYKYPLRATPKGNWKPTLSSFYLRSKVTSVKERSSPMSRKIAAQWGLETLFTAKI
ncbi:hypothetical protein SLEP1_g27139 [Rubroshorea leprosula]|uniref:Uncharacterized protein n=1 Tax=Rubroshorea leprosula TaxID=152421 RepID=A0AAV5JUZ3_9ROSI|nr:hypothetical protein SLEP1_g27139 [Rubroshorea leprosula]